MRLPPSTVSTRAPPSPRITGLVMIEPVVMARTPGTAVATTASEGRTSPRRTAESRLVVGSTAEGTALTTMADGGLVGRLGGRSGRGRGGYRAGDRHGGERTDSGGAVRLCGLQAKLGHAQHQGRGAAGADARHGRLSPQERRGVAGRSLGAADR